MFIILSPLCNIIKVILSNEVSYTWKLDSACKYQQVAKLRKTHTYQPVVSTHAQLSGKVEFVGKDPWIDTRCFPCFVSPAF